MSESKTAEVRQIITYILPWSRSIKEAFAWYRSYPIPALGGMTAHRFVKEHGAGPMLDYLATISIGGYA